MRILNERDAKAIIYATALMGAGGGGSLAHGLFYLDAYAKNHEIAVKMISVDEMEDGAYAGVLAGMGSPVKFRESGTDFLIESVTAYDGLKKVAALMNRRLTNVFPIEYGAGNSFVPMLVAMERDEPFVDVDPCGRAVPALNTTPFAFNHIATAPSVMSNGSGDVVIAYPKDPFDAVGLENLCRNVCVAFDMVMGIAGWLTSKEQMKASLVPGAYTKALEVGHAMLNAIEEKRDVGEEISKVVECRQLWRGRLTKHQLSVEKGFDFGRTYYEGIGEYAGRKFRIDYQNENLAAFEGDQALLTVPDLICTLNLDTGCPVTNAELEEGQNILVLAMPAPDAWHASEEGWNCWAPFLDAIGYKGKQVRY
ncbi:MAG: DUF917 domain-containing protein [Anaerovoracaceae bacterium]